MSTSESNFLIPAELEAVESLREEIGKHIVGVMDSVALVEKTIDLVAPKKVKDASQCQQVALSLLNRLGNDLRSTVILAGIGLPAQAVSLAAGSFESAYTLAYIAGSDERSQEWIDHDSPTKPFKPIKALVKAVIPLFVSDNTEKMVDYHYRYYRQLCMGKHGNPMFSKQHSYTLEDGSIILALGPSTTSESVRALQFALEHSISHTTKIALSVLASAEPSVGNDCGFRKELTRLSAVLETVRSAACERWGQKDPFEGKW